MDGFIEQTDGNSCGVIAVMHAYYVIVQNKYFATPDDFCCDFMAEIRLQMINLLRQQIVGDEHNEIVDGDLVDPVIDNLLEDDQGVIYIDNEEEFKQALANSLQDEEADIKKQVGNLPRTDYKSLILHEI